MCVCVHVCVSTKLMNSCTKPFRSPSEQLVVGTTRRQAINTSGNAAPTISPDFLPSSRSWMIRATTVLMLSPMPSSFFFAQTDFPFLPSSYPPAHVPSASSSQSYQLHRMNTGAFEDRTNYLAVVRRLFASEFHAWTTAS